jgi:hypothetical protein
MKNILQNELRFLGGCFLQIDPEKQTCVCQQRGHQERVDVLRVQAALGCKDKGANHISLSLMTVGPLLEKRTPCITQLL